MTFTPYRTSVHASGDGVVDTESASASASERAYRVVLDAIVSSSTPPGELIAEGEVADQLAMSRTPVREAFLRLAAEGVLQLYPKRGAVVSPMTDRDVRDLLDTRLMFETTAVRWLSDREVPVGLADELGRALAVQTASVDDPLDFARADRDLHEAVVAAADNPVATGLFRRTGPRLLCLLFRVADRDDATRARVIAEHEQLMSLALARDAAGYATALEAHVRAVHHDH